MISFKRLFLCFWLLVASWAMGVGSTALIMYGAGYLQAQRDFPVSGSGVP